MLLAVVLLRVALTVFTAFCVGSPETVYQGIELVLSNVLPAGGYSFLQHGDFTGVKIVGYSRVAWWS